MILDNKRERIVNNHKKIFSLYKELKKTLPIGYLKTRVSKGQRYPIKNQSILTKIEKEKIKELLSPSKITQNLFFNKNIYFFSGDNESTKNIIQKMKNFKQSSKQISLSNDDDISININKKNIYNNYLSNIKNKKQQDIDINCETKTNNQGCFRSTTINNCFMKNNIFLPSIMSRIKNNMPRYERQSQGFLLEGVGEYTIKNLYNNEKNSNDEYTNIDEDFLKTDNQKVYETIKLIKKNNIGEIDGNLRNMSNNRDSKEAKIKINKYNDIKYNFKKFLIQNNLKANDLKITGFKKINKNLIK